MKAIRGCRTKAVEIDDFYDFFIWSAVVVGIIIRIRYRSPPVVQSVRRIG